MSNSYALDPFDTRAFLKLPQPQDDSKSALIWQGFHLDTRLENEVFSLADVEEESLARLETGLFELKLDEHTALTPVDASSVSEYATADEDSPEKRPIDLEDSAPTEDVEDVWVLPHVTSPTKKPTLTSWNHFPRDNKHEEPRTAYLSEANHNVFDAVVQATCKFPVKRVKLDDFLNALYELALGRNSAVFTWDEQTFRFKQNIEPFTVTGFTPGIIQAVVEEFKSGGEVFRTIQRQRLDNDYDDDNNSNGRAEVIAFDAVLRSCLFSIETYMELQKSDLSTVLGLRRVFEGPLSLLQICKQLNSSIFQGPQTGTTIRLQSLLNRCLTCSLQQPRFRPLINHFLTAVCTPILRSLGAALGLGVGPSLVLTGRDTNAQTETVLHNVFAQGTTLLQLAEETHESLHLLSVVAPERLSAMAEPGSGRILRLAFSWDQLNSLQQAALNYEREVRSRMQRRNKSEEVSKPHLDDTEDQTMAGQLHTSDDQPSDQHDGDEINVLPRLDIFSSEPLLVRMKNYGDDDRNNAENVALTCLTRASDGTDEEDDDKANSSSFLTVPLTEVLDLSLSPFILAQHRLLSYNVLDTLFSTYRFDLHLHLLRQIYLFGDGTFTSRLGMALFGGVVDDDYDNDDDQVGLRLQTTTRDSWPPASSALRLVLMGVLSDSVRSVVAATTPAITTTGTVRELEDTTSFAIRDLSDDELEACRDVNSIHALDFLKLQYKTSNPLLESVVATADSLSKYDIIFKHLLRVLRMKMVAQSLVLLSRQGGRSSRSRTTSFRVEIHHFMANLSDYSVNVAIGVPWTRFQETVKAVENKIGDGHWQGGGGGGGGGLALLRQAHASTLDQILRGLLLVQPEKKKKKTQKQQSDEADTTEAKAMAIAIAMAMNTLETLFNLVLAYAATTSGAVQRRQQQHRPKRSIAADDIDDDHNNDNNADDKENKEGERKLHAQFQHHVRRFKSLVATVVAGGATAAATDIPTRKGGGKGAIDPLAHLLLMLDFN